MQNRAGPGRLRPLDEWQGPGFGAGLLEELWRPLNYLTVYLRQFTAGFLAQTVVGRSRAFYEPQSRCSAVPDSQLVGTLPR